MTSICWTRFKNFKPSEFKCGCGCVKEVQDMDCSLLFVLQAVRTKFGKPVNIKSGYRCKKYNASLPGSVINSDHLIKKAADIQVTGYAATLKAREQVMDYIMTLPNVKYCYCNGRYRNSNGTNKTYSAKNMGYSIHISVN